MCGVVGLMSHGAAAAEIYDALIMLQHRGQDAAGIMTDDEGMCRKRRARGLVRETFRTRHMQSLRGSAGLGHVRYPTAGSDKNSETQPFFVNSPYGIALAHNGNLTNAHELAGEMRQRDRRYLNTDSDSELLLNVFAHELLRTSRRSMDTDAVFRAVRGVHKRCKGAYSVVCLILGFGLVAFRDPYGIRPMVVGRRESAKGPEYLVASESVALQQLGFELLRDVTPGVALDVGCSIGVVLDQLRQRGWTPYGVDVSAYATEYARREFGLNVFTGTLDDVDLPPDSVDLATMLLTIEHLPDPKGVLRQVHRLLKPGGVLIVGTHDVEGLWPRIVGARWRHYSMPEHVYYFSRRTLTRMLADVGLETFRATETATLAGVVDADDTNDGLYAPVRLLHKTRLIGPVAPFLRAMHSVARRFDWADGITTYARKE